MRFDQSQSTGPLVLLPAALYLADSTPVAVALGQFQSCSILLEIGVGGITFDPTNKIEYVLSHCDTLAGTYTAVAQADVVGTTVTGAGIILSLIAAKAAASAQVIGYVGGKVFMKLFADFSGVHGVGTVMAATALRERPLRV